MFHPPFGGGGVGEKRIRLLQFEFKGSKVGVVGIRGNMSF